MSNLLARAKQALVSLDEMSSVREQLDETSQLKRLVDELEAPARQAVEAVQDIRALHEQGVRVRAVTADAPLTQLNRLAARFKRDPAPANLRRGRQWPTTLEALEGFVKQCEEAQSAGWRAFLADLFTGEAPEQLRDRIAPTPENQQALARYQAAYREKAELARKVAPSTERITRAHELAAELESAYANFDFNVPDEVKAFFKAAASSGGASLSLLTPNVLEWLAKNEMLDRFSVRNRSS